MFFKGIFYFCSLIAFCAFAWLRLCAFWCFWCVQNLFVKKNKEFKTSLITSITLLFAMFVFLLDALIPGFSYSDLTWETGGFELA